MKRIILFIKKFFAWILSFFFDRNKTTKKKKIVVKTRDSKEVKIKEKGNTFVNRDEDMGESHIVDIYPYTEAKELKSIQDLIDELEESVNQNEEKAKELILEIDRLINKRNFTLKAKR